MDGNIDDLLANKIELVVNTEDDILYNNTLLDNSAVSDILEYEVISISDNIIIGDNAPLFNSSLLSTLRTGNIEFLVNDKSSFNQLDSINLFKNNYTGDFQGLFNSSGTIFSVDTIDEYRKILSEIYFNEMSLIEIQGINHNHIQEETLLRYSNVNDPYVAGLGDPIYTSVFSPSNNDSSSSSQAPSLSLNNVITNLITIDSINNTFSLPREIGTAYSHESISYVKIYTHSSNYMGDSNNNEIAQTTTDNIKSTVTIAKEIISDNDSNNNIIINLNSITNNSIRSNSYVGVPDPTFGLEETHMMYDGEFYDAGGFLYNDAGNGPYTHYIDNTHVNATDVNNPYGTSDNPRMTLPTIGRNLELPEGSVIEIHGGPYTVDSRVYLTANGTEEKPVFIRAVSDAVDGRIEFNGLELKVAGEYAVIENIDFYDRSTITIDGYWDIADGSLGSDTVSARADHIAVRNIEAHQVEGYTGGSSGIGIKGDDILVINSYFHDNWKEGYNPRTGETYIADAHGIYINEGSSRIWLLNNETTGNSGNGFQVGHGAMADIPEYIYVAGNKFHGDRELGIGLKWVNNIVISENEIYDYRVNSTSTGTGIVVGADGPANNVWIINNNIHNAPYGVRIEETETDVWIIGNTITNIDEATLNLEKTAEVVYFVNNTISDVGYGIQQNWRNNFDLDIQNNIFNNVANRSIDISHNSVSSISTVRNNLFDNDGAQIDIRWPSVYSLNNSIDTDGLIGWQNNIIGDSIFNTSSNSFELLSGSSAIGQGGVSEVYQQFMDSYGIDIFVDSDGNSRSELGGSIGAIEYITANYSNATEGIDVQIVHMIDSIRHVTGSDFNDIITGDINANIITGAKGSDILTGGGGADTFFFSSGDTLIDTINDFNIAEGDKIDISDILSNYDPLNDLLADFVQVIDNGTDSSLFVDVNGGGDSFVQIASLIGVTGFTDQDSISIIM